MKTEDRRKKKERIEREEKVMKRMDKNRVKDRKMKRMCGKV